MKNKKVKYLTLSVMALVAIGLVVFSITTPVAALSGLSMIHHAVTCVSVNGNQVGCSHNVYTSSGMNYTRDLLGKGAGAAWGNVSWVVIGNGSTPTSTSLVLVSQMDPNCALGPQLCAYHEMTNIAGNWSCDYQWTSSCAGPIGINTTMLHNSTAATNISFAGNSFTTVSLLSGDKLNVTWYVWSQ